MIYGLLFTKDHYTYKSLAGKRFASLDVEEFDNMANLCASILVIGLPIQIKRGLIRQYLDYTEEMSSIKSELEVAQCIKRLRWSIWLKENLTKNSIIEQS